MLIAQFGMIATKIAYESRADCVSFDKLEETFMIKAGGEKQCHLLTPCLLGADNLPFNVSFDVVFGIGSDRVVGKHGGVLLGIEYNKLHTAINRFTNKHGTVNIIDWIDRSIDRGYRVYEKSQDLSNRSSWNGKRVNEAISVGKHWLFKYKSTEECQFFVDNEFITRFKPVRCGGYIEFYQWSGPYF